MKKLFLLLYIAEILFLKHSARADTVKIDILVNEPLKLNCSSDKKGDITMLKQSKNLSSEFFVNNNSNESMIVEKLKAAENDSGWYTCRRSKRPYLTYHVSVGFPPTNLSISECVSENWRNLKCNVSCEENKVTTSRYIYSISNNSLENPIKLEPSCHFEINGPNYDSIKSLPTLQFMINSTNSLGKNFQNITLENHHRIVKLDPPSELEIDELSSGSVDIIRWKLNENLIDFPEEISFDIDMNSTCNQTWKEVNTEWISAANKTHYSLEIRKADYANVNHTIRLRTYTSFNKDQDAMKSAFIYKNFISKPRTPQKPEFFEGSSFSSENLYWKKIDKCRQNGLNFTYVVEYDGIEKETDVEHFNITDLKNLTIKLWSRNHMGDSIGFSSITIPDRAQENRNIQKVLLFKSGNSRKVIWEPSQPSQINVSSYYVFWCETSEQNLKSCETPLNSIKLQPNETSFEIETKENLNFAVAANFGDSEYQKMIWASCLQKTAIQKVIDVITKKKTDEITLKWNVPCENLYIAKKFLVECCLVNGIPNCRNASTNSMEFTFKNLQPYTNYEMRIWIEHDGNLIAETLITESTEKGDAEGKLILISAIILIIVIICIICIICIYKKYKKMSNLSVELPPELRDDKEPNIKNKNKQEPLIVNLTNYYSKQM